MDALEQFEATTGISLITLVPVVVLSIIAFVYLRRKLAAPPKPRNIPTFAVPKPKPKAKSKPTSDGKHIKIFFGSQTGTAEDFALTLETEGKQWGFAPEVVNMEDYDPEDLSEEEFIMVVVATYGEGEPTDNAKDLYDWLADDARDDDLLESLQFTVFGLGNKTYEHYNQQGKFFNKRLAELGAKRVYRYGEGDDDSTLEDDFASWKKDLWPSLCKHFGMKLPEESTSTEKTTLRFKFVEHGKSAKVQHRFPEVPGPYELKRPAFCSIEVNRELHTTASDRSCRHIEIDIGSMLRYEPGDHLGIYPENDPKLVECYGKRLDVDDLDAIVSLENENGSTVLGPCTIRNALSYYCDLTSCPRKSLLQALASYANESEKAELLKLSAETGQERYNSWIKNDQRTVLEVLEAFPSCKPPIGDMLELLPRLVPRYYSISSSLNANPGKVHVTAVVVEFTTPSGRFHKGVATHWLSSLPTGRKIPCFVRKSNFHLPRQLNTPILMIGPGTGLAPFRGFIQERSLQKHKNPNIEMSNELYFGCRRRDTDYIYQDELEQAEQNGLIKLHLAFSREQEQKVYVQHKLAGHSEKTWKLISQGGYIYVCGDARVMAKDVHSVLENIVATEGGKTEKDAAEYISKLQKDGRYLQDVWF